MVCVCVYVRSFCLLLPPFSVLGVFLVWCLSLCCAPSLSPSGSHWWTWLPELRSAHLQLIYLQSAHPYNPGQPSKPRRGICVLSINSLVLKHHSCLRLSPWSQILTEAIVNVMRIIQSVKISPEENSYILLVSCKEKKKKN